MNLEVATSTRASQGANKPAADRAVVKAALSPRGIPKV